MHSEKGTEFFNWAPSRPFESHSCICNYRCVFALRFAKGVSSDLKRIRAYDRKRLIDTIEEQLRLKPTLQTRNRKLLASLLPGWSGEVPVWELRVGEYRIFYDVSEEENIVYIRAVRRKPAGKSTQEIL